MAQVGPHEDAQGEVLDEVVAHQPGGAEDGRQAEDGRRHRREDDEKLPGRVPQTV